MMKKVLMLVTVAIFLSLGSNVYAGEFTENFEDTSLGFSNWNKVIDSPRYVTSPIYSGSYSGEFEGGWERMYRQGAYRNDSLVKRFNGKVKWASCSGYIKPLQWQNAYADILRPS